MPVRNLRDATIKIADASGTGGANVITVDLEDGGIRWTERNPVDFISDRGTLDHARQGDDEPLEGSLSMKFQTFQDPNSATETPYEAVTQTGAASGWTSDASSGGDAYAFIMEITITDPNSGSSETITITECYAEDIEFAEGSPFSTLNFNWRALLTRPAYS